jgi:hypothetical protein
MDKEEFRRKAAEAERLDTSTMASHRSRMVGHAQEDAFFRVEPPAR